MVASKRIGGGELGLLAPGRAITLEYVDGTAATATVSTHDGIFAAYRHRNADMIACSGIGGGELGLLGPCRAGAFEYVGSAAITAAVVVGESPTMAYSPSIDTDLELKRSPSVASDAVSLACWLQVVPDRKNM